MITGSMYYICNNVAASLRSLVFVSSLLIAVSKGPNILLLAWLYTHLYGSGISFTEYDTKFTS